MNRAPPLDPQAPGPLVHVVDRTVDRARSRFQPHVDALARSLPRSVRAHTVSITVVVVAVAAFAGAIVLWVALLWSCAGLLEPHLPRAATLFALAGVHLGAGGALAARFEEGVDESDIHGARPVEIGGDATAPGAEAQSERPTRARVEVPRTGAQGRKTDHRPRRRRRQVSPYRMLAAGVAVGLALERALR